MIRLDSFDPTENTGLILQSSLAKKDRGRRGCTSFQIITIPFDQQLFIMSMQQRTEEFYRNIFSDLTLDREESAELVEFFENSNPPPIAWCGYVRRPFVFACESLSDDNDSNVALLRCVNAMVHALEQTCME